MSITKSAFPVRLAYGSGYITVNFDPHRTSVIEPSHVEGIQNERETFLAALDNPIASDPLRQRIDASAKICILFTDSTRATPNHKLIPWLLDYLSFVPKTNITLVNQLGSHRPNTRDELCRMLTPRVVEEYRVLNHEPENSDSLKSFGVTRRGTPVLINKVVADANLRILTGFIEPHFFAGFSGGPKAIMPGVAGLQTIQCNHGPHHISDPNATFGITHGNPLWEELLGITMRIGPHFLVNVSLNHEKEITQVFAGELVQAHKLGTEFVRRSAMQSVNELFDIVVTTNSGYPLDLNLYQGVKGMSAGARILKNGGLLILACECREGVPTGSPMDLLLRETRSPEDLLVRLSSPGFRRPEQWQAQIQALIQRRARVLVYSSLPDEFLRAAHLEPCRDIENTVREELTRLGPESRVAVLPQGPLTIPYVESLSH